MTPTAIPLERLALILLPVAVVLVFVQRWCGAARGAWIAFGRMVLQLLAVGYVLTAIFEAEHPGVVGLVAAVMLSVGAWTALRPLGRRTGASLRRALFAIAVGAFSSLALATQAILSPEPWFQPRVVVPLMGMCVFAAMNTVSLAGERFASEGERGESPASARQRALGAAMIPQINSLLAVGVVSLPGMMTGQILSGVSPLVAVRYQILVMGMLFGAAGLAVVIYLALCVRALDALSGEAP